MKKEVKRPSSIPSKLVEFLGEYGEQLFDSWSGKVVAWGYRITDHCGEEIWEELSKYGTLECLYPSWFLITKQLTIQEAIDMYGDITKIIVGKRGGYHAIIFGSTRFGSACLDPRKTKYFNFKLIEVE